MGERRGEPTDVKLTAAVFHAMPWWISLLFLAISVMLWMSGRNNPDDVIGLLERFLAALLIVVVVLVSQNLLLESVALVAALRLPLASRSSH